MTPLLLLALLVPPLAGGVGGCNRKKTDGAATQPSGGGAPSGNGGGAGGSVTEITRNPTLLYDATVQPSQLMLHGVKLGDPQSAVPGGPQDEPDPSGWVGFQGKDNVFRLDEGKVAAMSLADDAVLSKLDVKSEQDLFTRFGKPSDQLEAAPNAPRVGYVYKDRQMIVWFDRNAGKVTEVVLGS